MIKRLLMTIAAVVCLMLTCPAAPAPTSVPDEIDEALELLGAKNPEQKLDMTITMLNNAYENMGDYVKVLKDDDNNRVVMLINGDWMGADASAFDAENSQLLKELFLESLLEDDEDGDISAFFNLIVNTGRSLEVRLYNNNDIDNAGRFILTPSEMRSAVEALAAGVGSSSADSGSSGDDFDSIFADDEDPETTLKEVIEMMEEYLQSDSGMDAHIWIDPNAKRVIMTMTDDDFAEVKEYRDMVYMFKPMFLQSLTEDASNLMLIGLLVQTGHGLQVQLRAPGDMDNPLVLDYTADELMEVLGDE